MTETAHAALVERPEFDEVYAAHAAFLWRSARALGVDRTAVDDVLQDVFVVVHRRLPEFEPRGSIRTWLVRILVRVVAEHRRRFRRKGNDAPLLEEPIDPRGRSAHDELERNEAVRILGQILDTMNDEQRTVFVLAEVEQVPIPEIATALDVKVNTIYSRLRLARAEYERGIARVRARDEWRQR